MTVRFDDVTLADAVGTVAITVNGTPRDVAEGISLAAALLRGGELTLRTHPVTQLRRAPYCLMGVCFECVLEVDGRQQRACMTRVRAGMDVTTA